MKFKLIQIVYCTTSHCKNNKMIFIKMIFINKTNANIELILICICCVWVRELFFVKHSIVLLFSLQSNHEMVFSIWAKLSQFSSPKVIIQTETVILFVWLSEYHCECDCDSDFIYSFSSLLFIYSFFIIYYLTLTCLIRRWNNQEFWMMFMIKINFWQNWMSLVNHHFFKFNSIVLWY